MNMAEHEHQSNIMNIMTMDNEAEHEHQINIMNMNTKSTS
jgi:hypothetical protein